MRRRRSCRRSSSSLSTRRSSRRWARRFRAACCWWARPEAEKRCWPRPWRARRGCRSSPSPGRSSWRCSSAWAPAACATCSNRPRRARRAWSSSTRSTPSAASGGPDWAAATMSASRPSTSCWWRWTASIPTRGSSSSPPPTARISWTRLSYVPAVSTGASSWTTRIAGAGGRSSTCMCGANRWPTISIWKSWPNTPRDSPGRTWPTW